MLGFLQVAGRNIVSSAGPIRLRGVGLGGWMNMENFITGFPAYEEAVREALLRRYGVTWYETFFEQFLQEFFTEDDAKFLASLGFNLVRIPINYRHLESDLEPGVIRSEGFRHLDRVVELCSRHGIYTIIDLHAAPGYQNQDWHSDNPTHVALLWKHRHFQDRVVALWRAIAEHYRDNPWVAGYNLLNEPADPTNRLYVDLYRRIRAAVREVDPHHLFFLDGNYYSVDFDAFEDVWPDTVYAVHDYALPGFIDGGPYPGVSRGEWVDRKVLEETFLRRTRFMQERGAPIWVGEFGPVYTGDPQRDAARYQLLRDQLEIYEQYGVSWAIWTYKDIGLQGLVTVRPDSLWMQRIHSFLEKKQRLGADAWGSLDTEIRSVLEPIEQLFAREFPAFQPYSFRTARWLIHRLVRHILISEALVPDFVQCFADLSVDELPALMESFHFANCQVREPLCAILAEYARR